MLIGRKLPVDAGELLDRLAAGERPKAIATAYGCHYVTLRRRLSRHVRALGSKTLEQAIAHHVAQRIKARLPLALHAVVDQVMRR